MAFLIQHEVIKDENGRIEYWQPYKNGREHYHIKIWVEGEPDELDGIERVDYLLHPTFKKPHRCSMDREDKFAIKIWTWGMFAIEVTIFHKNGNTKKMSYYLSYDLPADNGNNYAALLYD